MKAKILLINLLLLRTLCLSQEIESTYTFYTNNKIYSRLKPDDMLKTDTANVHANETVVFVGKLKAISNEKYAYIVMKITKNNFNAEFNGKVSEFFIDFENERMYDLEAKKFYTYSPAALNLNKRKNDSIYSCIYKNGGKQATLIFNESLPKELTAKFFLKNNVHGVSKVITPNSVFTLVSYKINSTDLEAVFEKFKKSCTKADTAGINLF